MFLKNRNISSKIKRSKVTDYAALKGGCTGSPESTHVKIPHCWNSQVVAHILLFLCIATSNVRLISVKKQVGFRFSGDKISRNETQFV